MIQSIATQFVAANPTFVMFFVLVVGLLNPLHGEPLLLLSPCTCPLLAWYASDFLFVPFVPF